MSGNVRKIATWFKKTSSETGKFQRAIEEVFGGFGAIEGDFGDFGAIF